MYPAIKTTGTLIVNLCVVPAYIHIWKKGGGALFGRWGGRGGISIHNLEIHLWKGGGGRRLKVIFEIYNIPQ